MTPRHIAVVGPGLIGTSVALAARRAWPDLTITQFDRGESLATVAAADIVLLATPIDVIIDLLTRESHRFQKALVLDTGSTKRAILTAARQAVPQTFVGGHPMAGGASTGPSGARADLFDGSHWFLIPADPASPVIGRAEKFVAALGAIPVVMRDDGTEHDRLMAAVSHLPQVVASVLMKVVGDGVGEAGLRWAGAGLRDTTRLASSSSSMWDSILSTNASELRPLLLAIAKEITGIADGIDEPAAVRSLFTAANQFRSRLN